VRERLSEHALILDVTDAARTLLGEKGYDPEFGARPLRRIITNMVEDRLSDGILAGTFKLGSTIHIDAKDGELVMEAVEGDPQVAVSEAAPSTESSN
jgi:ATP-dependent Clp protease ATP-binding subunit ClpC